MRINLTNNFNQSFTSFKVTEHGAKELAQKFAQNPEFEKAFVDDVIKPLSYTITDVIYDGEGQVIINPGHNINDYYSLMNKKFGFSHNDDKAVLRDLRTGELIPIQLDSDIENNPRVNINQLITKLDMARKIAQHFDVNNRYYMACHSPNDPNATLRYNEDKLKRLFTNS